MTTYTFVQRLSEGLIGLSSKHGRQLWDQIALKKAAHCAVCKKDLAKGAKAYRPLTNVANRMERICGACIEYLEKRDVKP